jgi:hypothetical protein
MRSRSDAPSERRRVVKRTITFIGPEWYVTYDVAPDIRHSQFFWDQLEARRFAAESHGTVEHRDQPRTLEVGK